MSRRFTPRLLKSFCVLMVASLLSVATQAAESLGFRVPDGFQVSLYADDSLAHDIFSMTLDSRGDVVVAGKGYIKTLLDTNHDGKADTAVLFSSMPKTGAHGLYFDGDDLLCVGDGAVWRLRD